MSEVNGWFCWQSPKDAYEIGRDLKATPEGSNAGYVCSLKPDSGEFGALMQKVEAVDYHGHRICFSGKLKSASVVNKCGFFMEVFQGSNMLGIDNMYSRAVNGDQDWTHYELVLDVPTHAQGINLGVRLVGSGQVWIADLKLEIVGEDVPLTDEKHPSRWGKSPKNLDFSL